MNIGPASTRCAYIPAATRRLKSLIVPACAVLCFAIAVGCANAQPGDGVTVRSTRIDSGTPIKVKVLRPIGSDNAEPGDTFKVIVAGDDTSGLPTGMAFVARVTDVKRATPKTPGMLNIELSLPTDNQNAVRDVASAQLGGLTEHGQGHVAGAAATGGALLGLLRKGKIGEAIEGGAIGAIAGTAIDQSQKHSAADVELKKGSEITIKLDRSMRLKTVVVPD